jgi:hypothetical protein
MTGRRHSVRRVGVDGGLLGSALLARRMASSLCRAGCADYHATVQLMRLLDLVVTPSTHAGFYREALGAEARRGARDVLVSGCADYGMLATVLDAFAGASLATPSVTVLDVCETPVRISQVWAAAQGVAVQALVTDAARLTAAEEWDLITTESLLTLLTPDSRRAVAAAWCCALRPGGAVVTSCRIHPGGGQEPPSEDRAAAFEQRVRAELADGAVVPDGLSEGDLTEAARRFARSVTVWPVGSEEELRDVLTGGGLEVERLDLWKDDGLMGAGQAAAGARRPATYARIVARRP